MLYGCRLPLLIIDSVLMSALLGRSRDGSDTNGLPPSHCEVPPPFPPSCWHWGGCPNRASAQIVTDGPGVHRASHQWEPG